MTRMLTLALFVLPSLGLAADKVAPRVFLSVDKLPAGGTCDVAVLLEVEEGWHVNANPVKSDLQIPTTLAVKAKRGTKLSQTLYPAGDVLTLHGEQVAVYEGRVLLFATLSVPAAAAGLDEQLSFEVRYQACNDKTCLAPKTVTKPGEILVAGAGEAPKAINPKIFALKQAISETGTVIR